MDRPAGNPTFVYATRLIPRGTSYALGMPAFRPPDASEGWEVVGVSYTIRGIIVNWRRRAVITIDQPQPTLGEDPHEA